MRVSRLYVPSPLAENTAIQLDDDSSHYLRSVLRLKKDDAIVIFNGEGGEYLANALEVTRKAVTLMVGAYQPRSVESSLHLSLGLGIARGDKMDWSIQKSVELGVNVITPLLTERCVVQFKGEKMPQRWHHWQKIIQHAAEQSGRTVLPTLNAIELLPDWVGQQQGLKVFLDPYAQASLNVLTPENKQVTLMTGPEGGFANHERDVAKAAGFVPVRMGSRVLRTETASIAALSALQMLWGDFVGE